MLVGWMMDREAMLGLSGLSVNIRSASTLRNYLQLWVSLRFTLGGMSYNKWNGSIVGERALPLPGTAAAHSWHWTKQREIGYPESWKPACSSLSTEKN